MNHEPALWKASGVFAPSYPRQSSSGKTIQARRNDRTEFCEALLATSRAEMPGYYSVYSFPRGHSRSGNTPKVDTVFIDLDVPGDEYEPDQDKSDFDAWRREMSALLARARMIADAIIEEGQEDHFRVVLSGHKGLHLYLDFPTVAPNNGDFGQFKNGLAEYGDGLMSWIDSTAGGLSIDKWVDVDASDLGRLARHPNTIHHGAAYDDTERWCVPITMQELADLHVDDYLALTEGPRWLDSIERIPSKRAGEKVAQAIRNASATRSTNTGRGSTYKKSAVEQYEEQANDSIEIEDIDFLTANYPCIKAWQERDDAFGHGNASHLMEVNVIGKLVELNVPRDVIHEFFSEIPGYTEAQTDQAINTVIGREYSSFNCAKLAQKAGTFCLGEKCAVYRDNDDIQKR